MVDPLSATPVYALLLASAQQDVAARRLLAGSAGMGDAVVGFHAQQAVEKSIKAVLSSRVVEFRRTHDRLALIDLLEDHQVPAPPDVGWLDQLNPYAVEARYGTIGVDGLDRPRALLAAEQVLEWARQQTRDRRPP